MRCAEAATRGVLWRMVFLKILQNPQENSCARVFIFNKVAGLRLLAYNFIEKGTLAQLFSCTFCEIFKNNFFTEHLWVTASRCVQLFLLLRLELIYPEKKPFNVFKVTCHMCFDNFYKNVEILVYWKFRVITCLRVPFLYEDLYISKCLVSENEVTLQSKHFSVRR